jgi:hypothetical protein
MSDNDRPRPDPSGAPQGPLPGQPAPRPVDALVENRRLPASAVMDWVRESWAQFASNPLGWIGATLVVYLSEALLGALPVAGEVVSQVVGCVLIGGVMLGCTRRRDGDHFEFRDIFSGLQDHAIPLVTVGVALGLADYAFDLVVNRVFGGAGSGLGLSDLQRLDVFSDSGSLLLNVCVSLVGAVLLWMASWFAPALIVLYGQSPMTAIVLSFRACLVNAVALSLLSVIVLGLFIIGALPFLLGWLVVVPMWLILGYVAAVAIFGAHGDA